MGRRPITDLRPPTFVSRETGAAELDMTVPEFTALVRARFLPRAKHGLWWWPDIDAAMDPTRPRAERTGCIYFLGLGSFVKIGFTLKPIHERIARLQTGAPERLVILGLQTGQKHEEAELHSRFGRYRSHGEWFQNEWPVAAYIASLPPVDIGHG
jgi:hypothetical protein